MDKPQQRIAEKIGIVSVIEPPFQLIKIGVKVFCANLMVRTYDRPLQQTPNTFNCLGMHIAAHPFVLRMANSLVPRVAILNSIVSRPFVRDNHFSIRRNVAANEAMQGFPIGVFANHQAVDVEEAVRISEDADGLNYSNCILWATNSVDDEYIGWQIEYFTTDPHVDLFKILVNDQTGEYEIISE